MRRLWWKPCGWSRSFRQTYTRSQPSFPGVHDCDKRVPVPWSHLEAVRTHTHRHHREMPALTGSLPQSRCAQALASCAQARNGCPGPPLPSRGQEFPPTPFISVFPKQQKLQVGDLRVFAGFAGVLRAFCGSSWRAKFGKSPGHPEKLPNLEPKLGNQE